MRAALALLIWLAAALGAQAADCTLTTITAGPPKIVICTDITATTIQISLAISNSSHH